MLLQMLAVRNAGQIYIFCSDDRNARNGVVSLGGARCLSILSSFMCLFMDGILSEEEAMPYIDSYLSETSAKNQSTFRVHEASKEMRFRRVPCRQVFEEMYAGKFELLQNGNLKYRR